MSKSLSHVQYPNHQGANITELFEPTFAKLDKQVSTVILCQFSWFMFGPLVPKISWQFFSVPF
jgi:hypothetical protein